MAVWDLAVLSTECESRMSDATKHFNGFHRNSNITGLFIILTTQALGIRLHQVLHSTFFSSRGAARSSRIWFGECTQKSGD